MPDRAVDFGSWSSELARWGRSRGRDLALFDAVASTHDAGRRLAGKGAERPAWMFALEQTAGHGRFDREWSSPRGAGVYASYITLVEGDRAPLVPLALGVALCRVLESIGFDCRLRWPNDVCLDGAKLGGILVHGRLAANLSTLVASFGINRCHRREELPRQDATSLELASPGLSPPLPELTTRLADALEADLDTARETVVDRYRRRSAHREGDVLEVRHGGDSVHGRFVRFTDEGQLELETDAGRIRLASGELG